MAARGGGGGLLKAAGWILGSSVSRVLPSANPVLTGFWFWFGCIHAPVFPRSSPFYLRHIPWMPPCPAPFSVVVQLHAGSSCPMCLWSYAPPV